MTIIARLCLAAFSLLCLISFCHAQTLPTGISNLQLWLDASDPNGNAIIPSDGTVIPSWQDKSGQGKHTSLFNAGAGYTSPKYYSNQINGNGIIRFTKTTDVIGSGYQAPFDMRAFASPDITIFTVYKQTVHNGYQAVWGCDDGDWDRFFFSSMPNDYNIGAVSVGTGLNFIPTPGSGTLNQVKCLTAVYSKNAGANGSAIYLNGALVTNFTDATTNLENAVPTIRIGLDGNDNFFSGDIAEMIIYNRKLTSCEINQVNRYLNLKYDVSFSGVSVNANGPTTFNEGGSVTLSSTAAGSAYQWLLNDIAIPGATTSSYIATGTGNYSLAVTNSCIDTSAAVAVTVNVLPAPGAAITLDGMDDYITMGTTINAGSIKTLECWAKFSNFVNAQEILSRSKTGYGIELLVYGGNLAFYCMNGSNVSYMFYPTDLMVANRWYHLVATWDGTKNSMRMYVDGISVGTRSDVGNIDAGIGDPGAGSHLFVGAWNDVGRFFQGSVDEVRIWNTYRQESEIHETAYDTLVRGTPGLLAYLRMDEGSAGAPNDGVTSLKDYSAAGSAATLVNSSLAGGTSNFSESYAMVVPVPSAATSINSNGFTAMWSAPARGIAENYFLDVSSSSTFATFVDGYQDLAVGNMTSRVVNGLNPSTTYYYRVRADKTSVAGQGALSYMQTSAVTQWPLPVTWKSFSAVGQPAGVALAWVTSAELNAAAYYIERSVNGLDYHMLGMLPAQGTTENESRYNWTDNSPEPGFNYYRIRQVDIDGNFTYSEIRTVNLTDAGNTIQLYPSPAGDHLFVKTLPADENKPIIIYNLSAQPLLEVRAQSGVQRIDISALHSGMYILKVGTSTVKFAKK